MESYPAAEHMEAIVPMFASVNASHLIRAAMTQLTHAVEAAEKEEAEVTSANARTEALMAELDERKQLAEELRGVLRAEREAAVAQQARQLKKHGSSTDLGKIGDTSIATADNSSKDDKSEVRILTAENAQLRARMHQMNIVIEKQRHRLHEQEKCLKRYKDYAEKQHNKRRRFSTSSETPTEANANTQITAPVDVAHECQSPCLPFGKTVQSETDPNMNPSVKTEEIVDVDEPLPTQPELTTEVVTKVGKGLDDIESKGRYKVPAPGLITKQEGTLKNKSERACENGTRTVPQVLKDIPGLFVYDMSSSSFAQRKLDEPSAFTADASRTPRGKLLHTRSSGWLQPHAVPRAVRAEGRTPAAALTGDVPCRCVVRGKDARSKLPAFDCSQCRGFYAATSSVSKSTKTMCDTTANTGKGHDKQMAPQASRHRFGHAPTSTPPGFWDMSFPIDVQSEP